MHKLNINVNWKVSELMSLSQGANRQILFGNEERNVADWTA